MQDDCGGRTKETRVTEIDRECAVQQAAEVLFEPILIG